MDRSLLVCLASLALAGSSFGEETKAGMAPPDMSKAGPMTRIPKNEKQDKQELDTFFKEWMEAAKKGDATAMADMVDFPVTMMTDNSTGTFKMMQTTREQWMAMMKPMMENPKHQKEASKMTHKGTCFILSDDLASCEGEHSMEKMKAKMRGQMVMTRVDGKWKVKSMLQAGWGDMPAPSPKS